jgi:hypothetical protein
VRRHLDAFSGRLTRGVVAAVAVGLVTIVGLAVLVAVFARSWWRDEGGGYVTRRPVISARITPQSSLFGDVLDADVRVAVDPREVDPASVQLDPDFRPYKIRSESKQLVRGVGRASIVDFRYAIECITAPCVRLTSAGARASARPKAAHFAPGRLVARVRDGTLLSHEVDWPPFVVHSRLSAEDIAFSTPSVESSFSPPKVSWNASPNLLGGVALSAAVLLTLGAGWLLATTLLPDARRLRTRRIPAHLTPVERALRLAEHAAGAGELAEERKALQRLAVELRRVGDRELAGRAGRLAWSEEEPSRETVEALADAVRENGAH